MKDNPAIAGVYGNNQTRFGQKYSGFQEENSKEKWDSYITRFTAQSGHKRDNYWYIEI